MLLINLNFPSSSKSVPLTSSSTFASGKSGRCSHPETYTEPAKRRLEFDIREGIVVTGSSQRCTFEVDNHSQIDNV